MKCNICGCEEFIDMNSRKGVRCRECNSFERTRLLWMFLSSIKIEKSMKILHIAPEEGLYNRLKGMVDSGNYIVADIDPAIYGFAKDCRSIDLTNLDEWRADEFDLILHSHVLEHVPCNIAYILYHLHRMLRPNGLHLFVIPFMSGRYDECFDDIGDVERVKRFGQHDHVRRFGRDDIDKHIGKIVRIPAKFDATDWFSVSYLRQCNIPQSDWSGFHGSTVLILRKEDYMLLF